MTSQPAAPSPSLVEPHPVYPGGPPCQPNCPGPWSQYHDGYADGYENAEAEAMAPLLARVAALETALQMWLDICYLPGGGFAEKYGMDGRMSAGSAIDAFTARARALLDPQPVKP